MIVIFAYIDIYRCIVCIYVCQIYIRIYAKMTIYIKCMSLNIVLYKWANFKRKSKDKENYSTPQREYVQHTHPAPKTERKPPATYGYDRQR